MENFEFRLVKAVEDLNDHLRRIESTLSVISTTLEDIETHIRVVRGSP